MQENFPSLNFLHMEDFYTYLYADLHNIMEYIQLVVYFLHYWKYKSTRISQSQF